VVGVLEAEPSSSPRVAWHACLQPAVQRPKSLPAPLTSALHLEKNQPLAPHTPHPTPHTPPCAGVSLASGVQVSSLASWAQLASADALTKLAPALAMVALITAVLHKVRQGGPGQGRVELAGHSW